jgi:hypothetical protein
MQGLFNPAAAGQPPGGIKQYARWVRNMRKLMIMTEMRVQGRMGSCSHACCLNHQAVLAAAAALQETVMIMQGCVAAQAP